MGLVVDDSVCIITAPGVLLLFPVKKRLRRPRRDDDDDNGSVFDGKSTSALAALAMPARERAREQVHAWRCTSLR